jgi:hypothetical protein
MRWVVNLVEHLVDAEVAASTQVECFDVVVLVMVVVVVLEMSGWIRIQSWLRSETREVVVVVVVGVVVALVGL